MSVLESHPYLEVKLMMVRILVCQLRYELLLHEKIPVDLLVKPQAQDLG